MGVEKNSVPDSPEGFIADRFIAGILGKPTWRVKCNTSVLLNCFNNGPMSFAYTKLECLNIDLIKTFEQIGFNLIDTNIQFERSKKRACRDMKLPSNYDMRFAQLDDRETVEKVAFSSIKYSRFHLDPLIPNTLASDIKRSWAGNYFMGKRGDTMVVSTFQNKVVGFLQLLLNGNTYIIDLIAVEKSHQGKGLAGKMIEFAAAKCCEWITMSVGTQLSNIPSINLYQKLGFRICNSSYVFHYHGPVQS